MFKFLQIFQPIFNIVNTLIKNDDLNSMIKDSADTKEFLVKAIEKTIDKTSK